MEILAFVINSVLLGVALAMDAFSVTVANAIREHNMSKGRMFQIAGTFGAFQFAMPVIGWICIHTIAGIFSSAQKFIPWIGAGILLFIGLKMILEKDDDEEPKEGNLIVQGIATSIDALSVGFTISDYNLIPALVAGLIIGVVTIALCLVAVFVGKKLGNKFNKKASIIGGVILILIAIELVLF